MQEALETGVEVTPDELATALKGHIDEELHGTLGHLDGNGVIQFLGEGIMKKIRAADFARMKAAQSPLRPQPQPVRVSEDKPRQVGDRWDFVRQLENQLK